MSDDTSIPDAAALRAALDSRVAEQRQLRREHGVRSMATKAGAAADALLDSLAFSNQLAGLDPDAGDLDVAWLDLVVGATKNNP